MRLISCVEDRVVEVDCEASFETNVSFSFLSGALFNLSYFFIAWKQQGL